MTNSLPKGIFKRGNAYAVRFSVPTEVQSVVGKKEMIRSLGTKDLGKALSKRQEALDEIRENLFSDYKDKPKVRPKNNYGSTVRETAHRWLTVTLARAGCPPASVLTTRLFFPNVAFRRPHWW